MKFISRDSDSRDFDPRIYRPLEVTVSVTMHDIQGHIMKVSNLTRNKRILSYVLIEKNFIKTGFKITVGSI